MEGFALKIVVVGMTILLAGMVVAFMILVVKSGKKTMRSKKLFNLMEKTMESQERVMSLLRDGRNAGEYKR